MGLNIDHVTLYEISYPDTGQAAAWCGGSVRRVGGRGVLFVRPGQAYWAQATVLTLLPPCIIYS